MNINIKNKILLSNSVTWILMAVVSFVVYQNLGSLGRTADWVEHTQEVLRKASDIEKLVIDMETGERGFLITGKNEFLEPYEAAKIKLPKILDLVNTLISDNSAQLLNLKSIESNITLWQEKVALPEINKRRDVIKNIITMDKLITFVKRGKGKKFVDDIRDKIQRFKQIEIELMASRRLEATKERKFSKTVIILGTTFIILLSHILSLTLAGNISKSINFLKTTIKDLSQGVYPDKTQFESNIIIAGLEKPFEQIVSKIKSVK